MQSAPHGPKSPLRSGAQSFAGGQRIRRFAWWPRRLSNGSWVWLKSYYVKFPYTLDPTLGSRSRGRR